MYTQEKIIEKAKEVHGNKYDYSKVIYTKLISPVEIICPIHGSFFQTPHCHINKKQGCPKCGIEKRADAKSYTTEKFIEKAKEVHGDKYGYSKVKYKGSQEKICIICPKHGEFWQRPDMHLKGRGCKACAEEYTADKTRVTLEEFIRRAREIHGYKYDYSKVHFKNLRDKITIICPKHGEFTQTAYDHLNGGCRMCANEMNGLNRIKTTEQFIEDAKKIHGDKYDYSKTVYKGCYKPITVICKKHGDFSQVASYHLSGNGCPTCGFIESNGENELYEYIVSLVGKENVERGNRKILNGNELDIYIPSKKIAFEYNGLYWHSENYKDAKYHLIKTEECEKNGIQLIHIFEDEWMNKREICNSRIANLLGRVPNKVYARKCVISEVSSKDSNKFLDKNHIQGKIISKYRYGLYFNGELISLMTFGPLRKNLGNKNIKGKYELLRFCNKIGYSVVGGASRLMKHFIKEINPIEILSYADRRWSIGKLYENLNFKLLRNSKPSYFYVIKGKRINRFSMRKDILISKYGCKKEETEHEFCLKKSWYRIYDCGTKVYLWTK